MFFLRTLVLFTCIEFLFIIEPFCQRILGIFLLTNESESHRIMFFMTEYFVDEEKYFYLILLHLDVASSLATIIVIAIGSMFLMCLKYACGFFMIAR